ncbi:DUF1479-domain-containing protein [Aureobasidium sp. EXF-12298]|nr:DUF1479-domain-containing protein [Aureobasidium sp. EXF-12298]KAI4753038.1 DUF1479-domain-containing protein [Aureobasidium sp. EXF-12344]KAI4772995.1 DUF1479-domain-containing protein [Aureobasidium sp. EXF-3400]
MLQSRYRTALQFNALELRRCRHAAMATYAQKREGDIIDAFSSLSGLASAPLEPRFAKDVIQMSFHRLLDALKEEIAVVKALKSKVIPEIDFRDIKDASTRFSAEYKSRGAAIIRNVIPPVEAMEMKEELQKYIAANPQTKASPRDNPQVYELYWSPAQIRARSHPYLLAAQRFLLSHWHSKDPHAVSISHPTIYADRLRMRKPGDNTFALGPHVDGGGTERWEPNGYGRVYESVWQGRWEDYDPWEISSRLSVKSDLYQDVGACSMFRAAQGWLSLSTTKAREGTLLVNPMLKHATAYYLLRPFFSAIKGPIDPETGVFDESFLAPDNWVLDSPQTSWLQGASPGKGQELSNVLHPHLELDSTMVHIPEVRPGDYVAWHCDQIHAVDKKHEGTSDSSVLYIPACPLTIHNAEFLVRQRQAFLEGLPCPDFGGGVGETSHIGRPGVEDVEAASQGKDAGMVAFGLQEWDSSAAGLSNAQRELFDRANKILGFYD